MGKRVLIVDDDKLVRCLIIDTLETLGIDDVVEAETGDQCLDILADDSFDAILLDWYMPGTKGIDIARIVRTGGSTTPILMVTGESKEACVLEAIGAGITDYLVKPFDHAVLAEKLAHLCGDPSDLRDPMVYRARSVMTENVISITPEVTVGQAIEMLLGHSISGMPIVDDENRLVGIITEFQLMRAISRPDLKNDPVSGMMTTDVISVTEDTILSDVAGVMEANRIRRVPVVRNGELVGIVARRDLLRYIMQNEGALREFLASTRDDDQTDDDDDQTNTVDVDAYAASPA